MRALNFRQRLLSGPGDRRAHSLARRCAPPVQRFLVEGALPTPGTKIQADEKDVGEITSSAILPMPEGGRAVALGYLRREASGKEFTRRDNSSETYDDPRGLRLPYFKEDVKSGAPCLAVVET